MFWRKSTKTKAEPTSRKDHKQARIAKLQNLADQYNAEHSGEMYSASISINFVGGRVVSDECKVEFDAYLIDDRLCIHDERTVEGWLYRKKYRILEQVDDGTMFEFGGKLWNPRHVLSIDISDVICTKAQ